VGDRPGQHRRVLGSSHASGGGRPFVYPAAHLWEPGAGFADRLLRAAAERGVRGARIFDLQIALTAVEAGAREIWTHDRDFVSVPGLRVRDPLD
jgi:predicted nucleic acid-binding protein